MKSFISDLLYCKIVMLFSVQNNEQSNDMDLSYLFLCGVPRAQDVPPEVLRQREVKWLDMLSHWDKWMIKRFNKVSIKS